MKGLQGMIVAAGLGIVGAICNWFYIAQQARDYEKIQFLAVKPQTQIPLGETFKADHFMPVSIPKAHLGNLDKIAVRWDTRTAVIGDTAKKTYSGDELILQDDLKTPGILQPIERLGPDEVAVSISVDSNSFIADRVNPGDLIGFAVPKSFRSVPTPIDQNLPKDAHETEMIGPFLLLMIGNRTGSSQIYNATKGNTQHENIITVSVKMKDGKFDEKAERLFELKRGMANIQPQVILLPKNWKASSAN